MANNRYRSFSSNLLISEFTQIKADIYTDSNIDDDETKSNITQIIIYYCHPFYNIIEVCNCDISTH